MLTITDLKINTIFQHQNEPYVVLKYSHTHMGRGGATVRIKAKNLLSGSVLNLSFKGNDKIEKADISESKAQYLYQDKEKLYFMNQEDYTEIFLLKERIKDKIQFIKEGIEIKILNFQEKPMNVILPIKIDLKVEKAEPGVRGNTAQGSVTKKITLETGLILDAPIFIKPGDIVRVNTETEKYVERV